MNIPSHSMPAKAFALLLVLLPTLLISLNVAAQTKAAPASYPNKPIRIIVPYPPGGTSDILARTVAQKMGEAWNTQIIVDNKPGANGNIGADLVAKSPPDGYTLLLADIGSLAISPSVYTTLPFDPTKDFAPVGMIAYSPHILVVHPSVKVNTVKELIDVAKAKPGKLNYATSGVGGAPQLAGVEFAQRAGIAWTYIPYKGGAQAVADIVAKLNAELIRILKIADVRERLAAQGAEARTDSADALGAFIRSEKARWGKVVKDAGIRLE